MHVTLNKIRSIFCHKNDYYPYKTNFPMIRQRKVEMKSKIKRIHLPLHSPHSAAMFNVLKMLIAMVIMLWFVTKSICSPFFQNWRSPGLIKLVMVLGQWSPSRSVIVRVVQNRFVYHEYVYRPNWTTPDVLIPNNHKHYNFQGSYAS